MQVTYPTLTTGNLQAGSGVKLFGPTPVNQNFEDIVDWINGVLDSSITIPGASIDLSATYVGYGDADDVLTGDANFTWDSSGQVLEVNGTTKAIIEDSNSSGVSYPLKIYHRIT